MSEQVPEAIAVEPKKRNLFSRIFIGHNGLRVVWGLSLFLLFCIILGAIVVIAINFFHKPSHNTGQARPVPQLIIELFEVVIVAGATWLMSLVERRKFLVYNLSIKKIASRFFTGAFWGFAALSLLIALLWKLHFIAFKGVALHNGGNILLYAAEWAAVFLAVGLFEETFVRGYLQYTLTRGIGFWWASLLTSLFFMALHLTNTGESALGLSSVTVVGLTFCLSIYYTRSLWWAIGFHASWDWGQSYFYGTPDSGMVNTGHLLNSQPTGSVLWSGGGDGPEGSALVILVLILVCFCMWLWWGRRKAAIPN